MPEVNSPPPTGTSAPPRWSWLLPVVTFLAGLALGAAVVSAGAVDDDRPGQRTSTVQADGDGHAQGSAADDGSTSSGAGTDADAGGTGTDVRVPDSCVQTARDATALVDRVDRVASAVAGLRADRVRETIDDVQELRDEVRTAAGQCRDAAEQQQMRDDGATGDGTPSDGPVS